MKTSKTAAALLAIALTSIAAPALADGDHLHYEQNRGNYISYEKASQIAVQKVGGGQVTDIEFDRSFNRPDHFDVEVRTSNGQEYDVKVDAKTGNVLSSRLDD